MYLHVLVVAAFSLIEKNLENSVSERTEKMDLNIKQHMSELFMSSF